MATTLTALVARIAMDTSEVEAGSKQVRSDLNRVNGVFREMETEADKIAKKIESVIRQFQRGKLSAEDYAKAIKHLGDKYRKANGEVTLVEKGMAKLTAAITPQRVALVAATATLAGMAAAVAALVKAYDIATDKMAELDPIIKQSKAMGELTENVQSLAFALSESAGMSIDETTQSLTELQKRLGEAQLGTGEAANALKILGLNAADLARQSPVEQFRTIAAELQRVEDATMRAYLADKLFAEQGKKLVNGLMQSKKTLAEAEAQAKAYGLTVDKFQAAGIEAANDQLGRVRAQIDGIVTQFSAELAPALQFFATELQGILPLAGNMRMEFEMMVDTLVAAQAMARSFSAGLIEGLASIEGYGSEIGNAIAPDDVATVLKKFHQMRDAAREAANQANEARNANMANEIAAQKVQQEYEKQVKALKDQTDAAMGLNVAHQNALKAREQMTSVQREYLAILDNILAEEKEIAKQKEKAAKAEEKRLADLEDLRKRGEEMIVQNDPAKQMEKQLADLNVLLSVLGESFRSTYDREVQKIISDAAKAKLGDAERPGLIEAGTQGAVDVMQRGIFDAQEKQLQVQEEQKLLQEAQLAAQQETNRRLSELGLVTAIR